ncbi:ferric reductase-like transmembrane domain-containing protein [Tropicibacter sp. R16_0]|uniref:ferric reductase-like transmembrane domain-containing protein n=1 Tax=Tropicibacter sp. R16_0 TaxID=2821102 RepID=UPI001ADB3D29|nr:ferric reductase-like transmembrane domain-containing protein [Tropicibacter sp. R16_0]
MIVFRAILVWLALAGIVVAAVIEAAGSEFLQYRSVVYVVAGFAGVTALVLLLFQPLLASGYLPGLSMSSERRMHRWIGVALLLAVAVHVSGLWITSPPDMIDAMTFRAPTAFSVFGVVAMWALVISAFLAGFRGKLRFRPQVWRLAHTSSAIAVVSGTVAHVIMIEGTMGTLSKNLICTVLVAALALTVRRLRPWVGVWRAPEK